MQRFLRLLFAFNVCFSISHAQTNLPTSATGPAAAVARKTPVSYSYVPVSFIRTYTPKKPITDTSLVNMSASKEDVNVSTKYVDSYGRPIQTVLKKAAPDSVDLISTMLYDEFENQSIQYLPFSAQTGNRNDGKFKTDAFSQDSAFYHSNFPNEQINYGQNQFDGSPLNIPVKTLAHGNSWGGAGIGIVYSHRSNAVSDSVRLWTIEVGRFIRTVQSLRLINMFQLKNL